MNFAQSEYCCTREAETACSFIIQRLGKMLNGNIQSERALITYPGRDFEMMC